MSFQGSALPRVRYVYLAQDASDVIRMGGVPLNIYNTAQAAYNAADALQVALDISSPSTAPNRVIILVGNTNNVESPTVGGITLTANWNSLVNLVGTGPATDCSIGNINGNNASGNGFAINSNEWRNLRIASITSNATGTTGNGGNINLVMDNVFVGTVSSNGGTTNGNSGTIKINNGQAFTQGANAVGNFVQNIQTIAHGTGIASGIFIYNTIVSGTITDTGGSSNGSNGGVSVGGPLSQVNQITQTNNSNGSGFFNGVSITEGARVLTIRQNNNSTGSFDNNYIVDGSLGIFNGAAESFSGDVVFSNAGGGTWNGFILRNARYNLGDLNTFSITGATTINPASNLIAKGILSQSTKLTSANPTETINTITAATMPENWPVKFYAASGLTVTFTNSATLVCKGAVNAVINGTNGDWVEFTKINGIIYETNVSNY